MANALKVPVKVGHLPRGGTQQRFEASSEAREALARQFELEAVDRLVAEFAARPWRSDGVRIEGRFEARIVQNSVVTLEPIRQSIAEEFDYTFVPPNSRLAMGSLPEGGEIEIDPEAEDPPEVFQGTTIDFGPYLCEALSLAIDPYPRETQEAYVEIDTDPAPKEAEPNAFDVLARLVPPAGRKP